MINITMKQNDNDNIEDVPDETVATSIFGNVKIIDVDTGEILVNKPA